MAGKSIRNQHFYGAQPNSAAMGRIGTTLRGSLRAETKDYPTLNVGMKEDWGQLEEAMAG
jgi:hypothetical protein